MPIRIKAMGGGAPGAVAEYIISYILDNALKAGDALPSSNWLAGMIGVSRSAARTAMERLASQGWIYSVQGKGTYVASAPPAAGHAAASGLRCCVASEGVRDAGSSFLRCAEALPRACWSERLPFGEGETAYICEYAHSCGSSAAAICQWVIPKSLAPRLPENAGAFCCAEDALRALYGYALVPSGSFGVSAVMPSLSEAQELGVEPGAPLLMAEFAFSAAGVGPAALMTIKAREGRFKFCAGMGGCPSLPHFALPFP
jgi:DNA-binding GntR family transcriptional regulator